MYSNNTVNDLVENSSNNDTKNGIICEFCDYNNSKDSRICRVCEAELSQIIGLNITNSVTKELKSDDKNVKNQRKSTAKEISEVNMCNNSAINEDKIECEYCGNFNKRNAKTCYICIAEIDTKNIPNCTKPIQLKQGDSIQGFWKCPSCTYANKMENKCCEICFAILELEGSNEDIAKSDVISLTYDYKETWKCKKCKRLNSVMKYSCRSCKEFAPFFRKWVCQMCKYYNAEFSEQCDVCFTIKYNGIASVLLPENKMNDDEDSWENVNITNCIVCMTLLKPSDEVTCQECSGNRWYCNNRFCATIIFKNCSYCPKCFLMKGSNPVNLNLVEVIIDNKSVKARQCLDCGTFCIDDFCKECEKKLDLSLLVQMRHGFSKLSNSLTNSLTNSLPNSLTNSLPNSFKKWMKKT